MASLEENLQISREGVESIEENEDAKRQCYQDRKPIIKKTSSSLSNAFESRTKSDILDIVGGNGPWQLRIMFTMLIVSIPGAMHNLSMTFLAPEIDHWCAKPLNMGNVSMQQWRLNGLPPGEEEKKCYKYENISFELTTYDNSSDEKSYRKVACDSWDYNNTFYSSTILEKWNLVCDQEWLVSLSSSVFMVGILVGVFVFGCVSDKFGRRPTIAICSFLMVSFAFICAFSVSFTMFIIARFMVAAGFGGYYTTFFVLLMEITSPAWRPVYGLVIQFGWCLGYVCLPAVAWLARDSFWIQIAITVPCIGLFGIWWIIPESPRWLLSQGKLKEAKIVLTHAAQENNIEPRNLDSTLYTLLAEATEAHESGETNGNVLDLLITPGLWKITLNVFLLWFVNAFVYFGLSFNTNELEGNPFLIFALLGAVEFPAYLLSIFIMCRLGRRIPIAVAMIAAGSACVLAYPLPEDHEWARVAVSMIGKFFITSSFGMLYVFTTELFPTVVRSSGLGLAALCEGIASIIAPFCKQLGDATHPVIPLVLIGILALVSGFLVLLLPETHRCVVHNTLKEAAEAARKKERENISLTSHEACYEFSGGHSNTSMSLSTTPL